MNISLPFVEILWTVGKIDKYRDFVLNFYLQKNLLPWGFNMYRKSSQLNLHCYIWKKRIEMINMINFDLVVFPSTPDFESSLKDFCMKDFKSSVTKKTFT